MNAKDMFEKLGYKEQADSEHIFYINDNYIFRCQIAFDLAEKEVELYDDHEAYTINNALLKAIQQQLKELGWLEEETCTNGSTYDSTEEFICSHCGLTFIEYKEYVNGEDDGEGYYFDFKPKYCPNCGRKIVD